MSTRRRIVVVGAGFLGGALAEAIHARGDEVRVTSRSGRWRRDDPPPIPILPLDMPDAGAAGLHHACDGADTVVVCWSATQGADGQRSDRAALYLRGAVALGSWLAKARPARLVYTSSTSALPDVDEEVDENEAREAGSERGRTQREAERIILDAGVNADVPVTVLRLAGLWGAGRPLGRIVREGDTSVRAGDGGRATNLVCRETALEACMAAIDLQPPFRGLIHVVDEGHPSQRELAAAVARARGVDAPRWERPLAAGAPAYGKRVVNQRMREVLRVNPRVLDLETLRASDG